MNKQSAMIRRVAVLGMFCALSYAAVFIGRLVPDIAGFLSYDPKDAVIIIAGFLFGPFASVVISVIVSFLEMVTISATGPYGFLMNVFSTLSFALPAALIYRKRRSYPFAIAALVSGVLFMTLSMVLWNVIITPLYMGVPRAEVAKMLIPVFLPFNLIKGGINAGITLLLYKPLVSALRRTGLLPPAGEEKRTSFHIEFLFIALAVLIVFLLLLFRLAGII